ncbi:MAG TPA: site-2 protease family protein [Candidatus Nitrosopelagicus sp.]|nr:site-2 protease family protein [Candidatus Nitrosopelagicus sp.]
MTEPTGSDSCSSCGSQIAAYEVLCANCGAPIQEKLISTVSSIFDVTDIITNSETLEFKIDSNNFKHKFVILARKLELQNMLARLEKSPDGMHLFVSRLPQVKRKWLSKSWLPRILFAVTVTMVLIDGYYRTDFVNTLSFIGNPIEMSVLYAFSLIGILGVHESGHLIAAKKHKIRTTWPYFIPGVPVFGIPTFGAIIQSRGLTINRDILFDVAIAGPIAGLIIAIIVSMFGALTSPVIDNVLADELYSESQLMKMNLPIFMTVSLEIFDKGGDGTHVIMSPIFFAAWLGFLITFLNLLPAWQLDGGHMARALFGKKWHKIATYASMGILVALGYWFMALFILILDTRSRDARPLDDISPLSKNRKRMFIVVLILGFLCAPLPFSILP